MEKDSELSKGPSVHDEHPPIKPSHQTQEIPHENLPEGYYPRSAEEKALCRSINRKMDIFLLPFLSLLYLFNGLDRGNVGNAATQGMLLLPQSEKWIANIQSWKRVHKRHWSNLK
jgi:hypothetical protein